MGGSVRSVANGASYPHPSRLNPRPHGELVEPQGSRDRHFQSHPSGLGDHRLQRIARKMVEQPATILHGSIDEHVAQLALAGRFEDRTPGRCVAIPMIGIMDQNRLMRAGESSGTIGHLALPIRFVRAACQGPLDGP